MANSKEKNDQKKDGASVFTRFPHAVSKYSGRPAAFILACLTIVVWGITGPIFKYSDTWQLVINTGTTIVTFLMVFLIQNTQNRDTRALQLKLDELIVSLKEPSDAFIDLEEMDEAQMQKMHDELLKRAKASGLKLAHAEFEAAEDKAKGAKKKK